MVLEQRHWRRRHDADTRRHGMGKVDERRSNSTEGRLRVLLVLFDCFVAGLRVNIVIVSRVVKDL